MSNEILIVVTIIAGVTATIWFVSTKFKELRDEKKNDSSAQVMNQNLQAMHERLDKAAHYIGSLGQELRSMQDIGKNINELRSAFFSPKLRGNFGEKVLEDMLANSFPKEGYVMQHKFKDGQVVDATICTEDGLICIDSKFPIDNYRRMVSAETQDQRDAERNEFQKMVRKHIGDIAKKYILPAEGTMNFAIMYVPSEAVFYEIISSTDELSALADSRRVIMTSPNTMSYFLHILRMGHERVRIEKSVQKVWDSLSGLQQDAGKFADNLSVLARHISNAKNAADGTTAEFEKFSAKVSGLKDLND